MSSWQNQRYYCRPVVEIIIDNIIAVWYGAEAWKMEVGQGGDASDGGTVEDRFPRIPTAELPTLVLVSRISILPCLPPYTLHNLTKK